MGFQTKSAAKTKASKMPEKGKPKKVFEVDLDDDDDDDDDMDSDEYNSDGDDSDNDVAVKKTPVSKSPKGKQTMSDRKVSFQLPGKNTSLVKTPKALDNSLQGKRQSTPAMKGKQRMQEFKGMKANLNNSNSKKNAAGIKKAEDDDEDEEDDDEDDDDEDDMDDDDIDEEEDDDDDDDEDDDDDDEDDEQDDIKEKLNNLKKNSEKKNKQSVEQTNKKATPVAKKAESPKKEVQNSNKVSKDSQKVKSQAVMQDLERKRDRDARNLFIKGLPTDITVSELKSLSPDIIEVSLPKTKQKQQNRKLKVVYAFLEFANEKKAEENYISLQNKKLRGVTVTIDYAGEKSKHRAVANAVADNRTYNKKKLYISGIPVNATIDQIAKLCPKAFQITLNTAPEFRNATAVFRTEEDAAETFNNNRSTVLGGRALTVLYSLDRKKDKSSKKRKRAATQGSAPPSKKPKAEVKNEVSEEDDDDDDEDED